MGTDVGALSASGLAGATKAEVERLVGLGVLVARVVGVPGQGISRGAGVGSLPDVTSGWAGRRKE